MILLNQQDYTEKQRMEIHFHWFLQHETCHKGCNMQPICLLFLVNHVVLTKVSTVFQLIKSHFSETSFVHFERGLRSFDAHLSSLLINCKKKDEN